MAKVLSQADLPDVDTEKFRLRAFIDRLLQSGEAETREDPIDLADIAEQLDGNEKAVLFRRAGPEEAELVGNVNASRKRLAMAFDTDIGELHAEMDRRLATKQDVVEIPGEQAPVQQVVLTGDDADLTRLPVHFQHELDGGPYISASLDYVTDLETGIVNNGARRLMLRGRTETGIDLVAPSDLKAIYEASARRGETLPVSFTVGAHPIDHVAASMRLPGDEMELLAALRGETLAVVRSVTNDVPVPADAELVIEGYLDERGHVEAEGPYGEFLGYYGVVKTNPVFHVTAITHRHDALFQTSSIGGRFLACTDTSQLSSLRTESSVWKSLRTAVREPLAVYATPMSGGAFNVRVKLRQRVPGEARNAIAAVFASLSNTKNVFVVDEDIDIYSDQQMDWAIGTRFQADRDLVVESGFRALPLDPSLDGRRTGSKAGFDLTWPFGKGDDLAYQVPAPPSLDGERFPSVADALDHGPKTFAQLMAAVDSRDGREVAVALGEIRAQGRLVQQPDGAYAIGDS